MTVSTLEIGLDAARFKAAETVATGLRTLEFYAAAFSKTPDANGDIIDPRAFDDWLVEFYAAAKPLPLSFSHAAVLDGLDPTNVIGYAPADPQHVWVDDYGLRVCGFIDVASEKGKAVEWQIENDLIAGASIAYMVPPDGIKKEKDHNRVMKAFVREAGPTPNPANQEAVLLWMKSEHLLEENPEVPYMSVDEFRTIVMKAVDESTWDGNRAMGQCSSAADYRSICAGERSEGDPDERQHWALPHHFLGRGPNAGGVRNALSRLPQTQGLNNADAARSHLEAHMREVSPDSEAAASEVDPGVVVPVNVDVGMKHQASPAYIQAAHDALVRGGAKCAEASPVQEASEDVASRLRRLRFMKTKLI